MSKLIYVDREFNTESDRPDKKNCLFNPSTTGEKIVCIIPAKAVRIEGQGNEKNTRTDFES